MRLELAFTAAAVCVSVVPAVAQQTAAPRAADKGIDELIVTARYRVVTNPPGTNGGEPRFGSLRKPGRWARGWYALTAVR